jgi:hypothetical protein
MDIENSPGAQAHPGRMAARDGLGSRFLGDGEYCGNCLCCLLLREICRDRRSATLLSEHGMGVL